MESLWGELEASSELSSPKKIMETQGEFLREMTDNVISATVEAIEYPKDTKIKMNSKGIKTDFSYEFYIESNFMDNYTYKIMRVFYGIKIYPFHVKINSDLVAELTDIGMKYDDGYYNIEDEEEFKALLKHILSSHEIITIIRNMKAIISEEYKF